MHRSLKHSNDRLKTILSTKLAFCRCVGRRVFGLSLLLQFQTMPSVSSDNRSRHHSGSLRNRLKCKSPDRSGGCGSTKHFLMGFTPLKVTHGAFWPPRDPPSAPVLLGYVNDPRFPSDNSLLPTDPAQASAAPAVWGRRGKTLMAGLPFQPNPTTLICVTHRAPGGAVGGEIRLFNYKQGLTEGILGVVGGARGRRV